MPRTLKDREAAFPMLPSALLRVSTMRHGWIGWKIAPTFAGVTESADTEPTGGPFGAEGSAGDAADAALAPRGIPIGDPSAPAMIRSSCARRTWALVCLPTERRSDAVTCR